jgi:hypothetical protein
MAARSLLAMAVYSVLLREIYGDQALQSLSLDETVEAIVTTFCEGIQANP